MPLIVCRMRAMNRQFKEEKLQGYAQCFDASRLATMREEYAPVSFDRAGLLDDRYVLANDGKYNVYYAPVGSWPKAETRVLFLGLTPGFAQMELAARAFSRVAPAIRNDEEAFAAVLRNEVAYAGSMRKNLCRMLDDLGFPNCFGVKDASELFSPNRVEITATSTLIYPVFRGAEMKNFTGGGLDLSRSVLFRAMLDTLLAPRVRRAPNALVIPFGIVAGSGVRYLCEKHGLSSDRILWKMPHPSGANGHRKQQFAENEKTMREFIQRYFVNAMR